MLTAELAKTDLLSGSILFLGYLFAACRYAGQTSMLGRQWRHRRIRDRVRAECYRSGIHPVQLPRISGWRATSRGCGRRFRRQSLRRHDRRGRISVRWRFGYGSSRLRNRVQADLNRQGDAALQLRASADPARGSFSRRIRQPRLPRYVEWQGKIADGGAPARRRNARRPRSCYSRAPNGRAH